MKRVILESPYSGEVPRNTQYARLCMRDCLQRGETPMASHLLYTQVLDDNIIEQRVIGIRAGHAWMDCVEAIVVYADYGISGGMARAIGLANSKGIPVEERRIISDAQGD